MSSTLKPSEGASPRTVGILAVALATLTAIPALAQAPVLDCAALNSQKNEITAFFGYTFNPGAPTRVLSPNFFDAGVVHGTVPIDFPKFAEHVLFSVTFPSTESVTWRFKGSTLTVAASSVTLPCQAECGSMDCPGPSGASGNQGGTAPLIQAISASPGMANATRAAAWPNF
jgi:hypothetical protein